jgi:hypothetical protein
MALAKVTPSAHYLSSDKGIYQFITIGDIINNFIVSQVGDDKIIKKAKRAEVLYHAQRGIAELNYDTLGNIKTQEIELPPSLSMALPHDYVKMVEVNFLDDAGIHQKLKESSLTGEPFAILQDSEYNYLTDDEGFPLYASESESRKRFKEGTEPDAKKDSNIDFLEEGYGYNVDYGKRYGLDPQHATKNGFYTINHLNGIINFTSNLKDKFIVIKYISDGLHADDDMKVHKFAEEALYKCIMYGLASAKSNIPEYQINRIKKERRAAIRNAKLRLAQLSPEEIIQTLRGKSKQIKH